MANLDTRNISNVAVTRDSVSYPAINHLYITLGNGTQKEVAWLKKGNQEVYRKKITVTVHTNSSYYAGSASQLPADTTRSFTMRWGAVMNSTELTAAQAQTNALFSAFDTNVASRRAVYSGLSFLPKINRTDANGPFYTGSNLSGAVTLNTYTYSGTADSITLYCKWINNNTVSTSTNGTYYMPLFARSVSWSGVGHGGNNPGRSGEDVDGDKRKECVICMPGHDAVWQDWSSTGYQGKKFYTCYDGSTAYLNYYNPNLSPPAWERYKSSYQPGDTGSARYVFNVNTDDESLTVKGPYYVNRRNTRTTTTQRSYYLYQEAPNSTGTAGVRYMRYYGNGALVYRWPVYNVYYTEEDRGSNTYSQRNWSAYGGYGTSGWPSATNTSTGSYGVGAVGGCRISVKNGSAGVGATYGSAGIATLTFT